MTDDENDAARQLAAPDQTLSYRMPGQLGRPRHPRRLHLQVVLALVVLTLLLVLVLALRVETARTPAIALTPDEGSAATEVLVSGSNFPSFARLQIRLGPPALGRSPHAYAQVIADNDGRFVIRFALPGTWPDGSLIFEESLEIIALTDDGSSRASAPLAFRPVAVPAPELLLAPDNGVPGEAIRVTGRYFPPDTPLTLQLQAEASETRRALLLDLTSSSDGTFSVPLMIPELWPGRGEPLQQSELVMEATSVDTVLASASFFNLAGVPTWTSYHPLDETLCASLQDSLSARLEKPVQRTIGPLLFVEKAEARGQSCQLSLVISVGETDAASAIIADLLQSRGWEALTPTRLQHAGDVAALHRSEPAGDLLLLTVELAEPDSPAAQP